MSLIKRTFRDERYTASNLLRHFDEIDLPDQALDAIDEVVKLRPDDIVAEPGPPYGN